MASKSQFNLKTFLRKQIARRVYKIQGTPIEICAPDNLDLLYITNEKVASSTIKANLIDLKTKKFVAQGGEDIASFRRRYEKPSSRIIETHELENKIVFSAVRNPFSRILSGYLNKSSRGTITFRKQFGDKIPINFLEFLVAIENLDSWRLDSHFRSQYLNLAIDELKYNYVFFLEKFIHLERFLLQNNNDEIVSSRSNATNASMLIGQYYGDREIALVRKIFARDFELFGYSNDPKNLESKFGNFISHSKGHDDRSDPKMVNLNCERIEQLAVLKKYNDFNQLIVRHYI